MSSPTQKPSRSRSSQPSRRAGWPSPTRSRTRSSSWRATSRSMSLEFRWRSTAATPPRNYPVVMPSRRFSADEASRLFELDRTHWLHPQGDLDAPEGTIPHLIMASGRGATVTDIEGREYIDGLASLWNVNVGHGRAALAEAAAEQMRELAFSSAYGGFSTAPPIKLAAKLAETAPGGLEATFFASGGAEANDTSYQIARLYHKLRREPERVNIVSRIRDYHGLTWGATSATGIAGFWKGFEPTSPGFLHAPSHYP